MREERRKEIEDPVVAAAIEAAKSELIPGEAVALMVTISTPGAKVTPFPRYFHIEKGRPEMEPASEPVLVPVSVRS